jgi:hypothetical protein
MGQVTEVDSKIWPISYIGNLIVVHSQLSDNKFPTNGALVGVRQVMRIDMSNRLLAVCYFKKAVVSIFPFYFFFNFVISKIWQNFQETSRLSRIAL